MRNNYSLFGNEIIRKNDGLKKDGKHFLEVKIIEMYESGYSINAIKNAMKSFVSAEPKDISNIVEKTVIRLWNREAGMSNGRV